VAVERKGRWRGAIEVPGLGTLNTGRIAAVRSVSCASAGNCAAGGFYKDSRGHRQGFVVSQRHGRWGRAIEVPGLGTLNKAGIASVASVSCAPPARAWPTGTTTTASITPGGSSCARPDNRAQRRGPAGPASRPAHPDTPGVPGHRRQMSVRSSRS